MAKTNPGRFFEDYKLGDVIEITESRPLSKTKNWVATRLVQKAALV